MTVLSHSRRVHRSTPRRCVRVCASQGCLVRDVSAECVSHSSSLPRIAPTQTPSSLHDNLHTDCARDAPVDTDLETLQVLPDTTLVLHAHHHPIGGHGGQVTPLVFVESGLAPVRTKQLQVLQLQVQGPGLGVLTCNTKESGEIFYFKSDSKP